MGWLTWTIANFQYLAGAVYALALLGSHAGESTIVKRMSDFVLSGKSSVIPSGSDGNG